MGRTNRHASVYDRVDEESVTLLDSSTAENGQAIHIRILNLVMNEASGGLWQPMTSSDFTGCGKEEMLSLLTSRCMNCESDLSAQSLTTMAPRGREKWKTHLQTSARISSDTSVITLLEQAKSGTLAQRDVQAIVTYLGILSQSQFSGVRFVTLCLAMVILLGISKYRKYISLEREILILVTDRSRDLSDHIRRLASLEIVCGTSDEMRCISDDVLCGAMSGMLADPTRTNRHRMLTFLQETLIKKSDKSRIFHLLDRIKDNVVRCCFDTDHLVRISALRLLSNLRIGEKLLGEDETAYQRLSNLVWAAEANSTDPFSLPREALVFVNNHIFASPGILGSGDDGLKLAAVVEFVLQYSDGFVSSLCNRFIGAILSYFTKQRNTNHFFFNSKQFAKFISEIILQIRGESPKEQQYDSFRKLCVVLEILLAVIQFQPDARELFCVDGTLRSNLSLIRDSVTCPDDFISHSQGLGSNRCIKMLLNAIGDNLSKSEIDLIADARTGERVCICESVRRTGMAEI
jgi:hypothetical protein